MEGGGKKTCGYSHEEASLAPALLSSSLSGGTTLLSVYLPSPDLCKATSDNPGLTYDPTLMFT